MTEAHKDLVVNKAHREKLVIKDLLVTEESLAHKDLMVQRDLLVHWEVLAQLDLMAHEDPPDL